MAVPMASLELEQSSGRLTPHPMGLNLLLSNKVNVSDLCWEEEVKRRSK